MGFFPETIALALSGATPKLDLLVKFDFLSEMKRIWNGFGNIQAGGEIWEGIGGLGSIDGLSQPIGTVAPEITFKVSGAEPEGVDANFVRLATGNPREFFNRPAVIYIQFFDDAWQPLDSPYAISAVLMSAMEVDRRDGGDEIVRQVSISAETIFYRRARPSFAYWSDRDQQARFPGDLAMERMSELQWHTVRWPDF